MQVGFEFTAAVPKRLRAAEDQPVQQSMRGERRITQAPSTDQKRVRREISRKTADLKVESDLYAEQSKTKCPDCGSSEHRQVYKGWSDSLDASGSPTYSFRCADCGHHHATPLHHRDPAWRYLRDTLHGHASAGQVAEHDEVAAKDEFDSEHIEPGGGRHHHHPRTAMDYTALMNDVGDCRSCGGNLVRQVGERGDSTITAKCADCGMEHQLQDNNRATAALGDAPSNVRLPAVKAIFEVDRSVCPDCGSTGWRTKRQYGHSESMGPEGNTFNFHVICRDCGHHYKVPRDDAAAVRNTAMLSLSWEPSTARYLPNPHQHMSAIARRAQSVLGTEENQ